MSESDNAQSIRQNLCSQMVTITQDPASLPLADALRQVAACLQVGEYLLASNACESLSKLAPDNPQLLQLWARALACSGAASKANAMMERLAALGACDEETLGLLARTYKDLWLQTGDAAHLRQAYATYLQAYEQSGGTWSGINAASLALVCGDQARARQLAEQVLQALEPVVQRFHTGTPATLAQDAVAYWDYATVGEAALILERQDLTDWAYANAARVSPGQWGERAASLRNAELLLRQRGVAREVVARHFQPPQVVMFTGHMLDAADRPQPRFPASAEPVIYQRILHTLRQWETKIGFSSAASGADILFLEALKELGAESNIVLPHPPQLFIETSVAQAGGDWVARFERVLADARQVTVLSASVGDPVTYHFTGIVMAGLATLRSTQVYGDLRGMTVWDLNAELVGGTGSTVSEWLRRSIAVERFSSRVDEPAAMPLQAAQGFGAAEELLRSSRQKIICMLFADAVGFSKLSEHQIPIFVEHFLGGVRQVMDRQTRAPLTSNTWGDGLYFTFDSVLQANDFALDLADFVNATDWQQCGLPAEMSLRIALHAGPAFEILDPVTQRSGFTGSHVSRAARIEPVTPPGYVYCSESHAALVALEKNEAYHCEFVGSLPFAKKYGTFPIYSLKRRVME